MPNEEMGSRAVPQPPDVATGIIIAAVGGFLGFVALTMAGAFLFMKTSAPDALRQATVHRFPEPALQISPQDDLKRFELEQRMALSGYAWINRSKGLVSIPITEAMRIIASRGDRAYDPLEPPASASTTANPAGVRP